MKEERLLMAMTEIDARLIQTHDPALTEKSAMSRKRRPLRIALLAAAVCALLCATALAVGLTVGWESFLGKTPEKAVTAVGESAVTGDYTLTLREAIVDDDGAALLLALTRNDGGVIQGDPQLYNWDIETEEHIPPMRMGEPQPAIRSEDGKTVWYCAEFKDETPEGGHLSGQTITFLCDGVVDKDWSGEEIAQVSQETVSLVPLASTVQRLEMSYDEFHAPSKREALVPLVEEISAQAAVPLTKMGEGNGQVSAVLLTSDGHPMVAVGNSRFHVRQGQYLATYCYADVLTDTRTGERWKWSGSSTWVDGDNDDGFYLSTFRDCTVTEEDLPYFEVTIQYGTEKILSDEPVELSFSTDVGHQVTMALDEEIEFNYIGDCTAYVTSAKVSALRLRLNFDRFDRDGWDWDHREENTTRWALVYRDGTAVPLSLPVIKTGEYDQTGAGWIDLEARTENGDRALIDPDQVAAIQLGDTRIDVK